MNQSSMPVTQLAEVPAQVVGKYKLGKVLGAGDFDCRIRLCKHIVTHIEYAVKIYDKDVLQEHQWMWEQIAGSIQVMRALPKHDHLVEMVECFETEKSLYILMQFVSGLSLLKVYLTGQRTNDISMNYTKAYFAQIVFGVAHLHANNVVHLGLAPDHIIITENHLAKIGFLVSCSSQPKGVRINKLRGTTTTVAPEVLEQVPYDPYLAEMWSLGIVLYFMLSGGRYPFDGANTAKAILKRKMRPLNPNLPEDAKDLVGKLLTHSPRTRMTLDQLLDHPFYVSAAQLAVQLVPTLNTAMSPRPIVPTTKQESYVSSSISEGTVQIRLPKGLSEEDEAAFIIQHTWRLTKSLRTASALARTAEASKRGSAIPADNPTPDSLNASGRESVLSGSIQFQPVQQQQLSVPGSIPPALLTPMLSPTGGQLGKSVSILKPSATASPRGSSPPHPQEWGGTSTHLNLDDTQNDMRNSMVSFNDPAKSQSGQFFRSTSIYFDQPAMPGVVGHLMPHPPSGGGPAGSQIYKCPACGRLPPPRLTGTKAPYPAAKLKYTSDGKFEEISAKKARDVRSPGSITSGCSSPRRFSLSRSPNTSVLPNLGTPRRITARSSKG